MEIIKRAIVVSANCDAPTRSLHAAAVRVAASLRKQGFEVIRLFGRDATGSKLYLKLRTEVDAAPVSLVYVIAHGNKRCLFGSDGEPVFDKRLAPLVRGAVVIANACCHDGDLAIKLYHTGVIKATIGYEPKLRVTIDNETWRHRLGHLFGSPTPGDDAVACLTRSVEVLLDSNGTSGLAFQETKNAWYAAFSRWFDRDVYAGNALRFNWDAIRLWGKHNAGV